MYNLRVMILSGLIISSVIGFYNTEARPNTQLLPSKLPEPGECGVQLARDKIYGGTEAALDEFPWMALLEYLDDGTILLGCGGTVINNWYILTAAHCINDRLVKVRLGEFDIRNETDCQYFLDTMDCTKSISVDIEAVMPHPNFRPTKTQHDIALIKLKEPVTYTDFIKPICLPNTKLDVPEALVVAGWGQTATSFESQVKMKVKVPLFDKQRCVQMYRHMTTPRRLGFGQFCAGGRTGKDSCAGDSGGPLMASVVDVWYQFGVVSLGPTPCATHIPAVYTNTSDFIPWILETIKK